MAGIKIIGHDLDRSIAKGRVYQFPIHIQVFSFPSTLKIKGKTETLEDNHIFLIKIISHRTQFYNFQSCLVEELGRRLMLTLWSRIVGDRLENPQAIANTDSISQKIIIATLCLCQQIFRKLYAFY